MDHCGANASLLHIPGSFWLVSRRCLSDNEGGDGGEQMLSHHVLHEGTTLRDTGLLVILLTYTGHKTGAIRRTLLMRVKDRANCIPSLSRSWSARGRVDPGPQHPM